MTAKQILDLVDDLDAKAQQTVVMIRLRQENQAYEYARLSARLALKLMALAEGIAA